MSLTVALNGRLATAVVAQPPTVQSVLISGRTPAGSPDNAAGLATIVLTLVTTSGTIKITESALYTFVVPPAPLFVESSLQVPLRPGQTWAATSLKTEVRFTVLHLGPQTSIAVRFGAYAAQDVTWTDTGTKDVRDWSTEIVAFTPRNTQISEGFVSISVTAGSGLAAQSSATSFQFVDLTQPRINTALPSESRLSGGSVVLVGVSGFCKGTASSADICAPASFSATFAVNGVASSAQVYGYVTLASWLANDLAKQTLVGISEVKTFLAGIGPSYQVCYAPAVLVLFCRLGWC